MKENKELNKIKNLKKNIEALKKKHIYLKKWIKFLQKY